MWFVIVIWIKIIAISLALLVSVRITLLLCRLRQAVLPEYIPVHARVAAWHGEQVFMQ